MPYGMSDVDYAREVQRKQAAGIKLTQPLDKAAYERGLAQLQKQSGTAGSSSAKAATSGSGGTKAGGTGGAVYWGGGGGAPSISDPKVQEHIKQVATGIRSGANPVVWRTEPVETTPQEDPRIKILEQRLAELEAQNAALQQSSRGSPRAFEGYLTSPTPQPSPATEQLIAELEAQNAALQQSLQDLQDAFARYTTPYTPAVTQPTVVAPQPAAIPSEVAVEGVTPSQPAASAAAAARPGADVGGFRRTVTPPAGFTLPSPDRLYELWKEVSGREEPGMAEYFAGPQFQSVAQGSVPVWMAADPTWRLFLARLGLLRQRAGV